MTIDLWLLYVGTVLVFMATPGPSHLLMLSVSLSNGFRRSLATASGDLTANAIQMLLAGLGLATVIAASRYGFAIIKWAGVLYLVWIGLRQIIASYRRQVDSAGLAPASFRELWVRGFVTSAANPKAVVFFAALFPQFIDSGAPLAPQLLVLGATYIVIDGMFLATYGAGAGWLGRRVRGRSRALIDRVAGAGMIGAAILLGLRGQGD
ncbi:MAG: LysE family transporter [Woeseiaceae bacterium]|nr:LysE family transporter [Woeseiaceae bacterium]